MKLSLIAALDENGLIGKKGELPWHIPEDLIRFKRKTVPHPVIMGRKTYESILNHLGKPLPKRPNIVISKNPMKNPYKSVQFVKSIANALEVGLNRDNTLFIIGGQSLYQQFLPLATHLYLTHVKGIYEGDKFFPDINYDNWKVIKSSDHEHFLFVDYKRI